MMRPSAFWVGLAASVALSAFLWFVFHWPAFFLLLLFPFAFLDGVALFRRRPQSRVVCTSCGADVADASFRYCPACGTRR